MSSRPSQPLPIVETPKAHRPGCEGGHPTAGQDAAQAPAPSPDLSCRVQAILDLIRPAIQDDGGDVELVDISAEGQVRVRFHGACVGCPSSPVTLQTGIERNLREHVPEVTSVVAVP